MVQRRATKMVQSLKNKSYEQRLQELKLTTLEQLRKRGDLIEIYKILFSTIHIIYNIFDIFAVLFNFVFCSFLFNVLFPSQYVYCCRKRPDSLDQSVLRKKDSRVDVMCCSYVPRGRAGGVAEARGARRGHASFTKSARHFPRTPHVARRSCPAAGASYFCLVCTKNRKCVLAFRIHVISLTLHTLVPKRQ